MAWAIDPAVGIGMVTGIQEEAVGREAMRNGASDDIVKPLDLQSLENSRW